MAGPVATLTHDAGSPRRTLVAATHPVYRSEQYGTSARLSPLNAQLVDQSTNFGYAYP